MAESDSSGTHRKRALTSLLILQALGAISLVAYPGVLVAGVMGLAAPGADASPSALLFKAFLLASFVYPLVWLVLWGGSWLAFRRGRNVLAFALSLPPALVSIAAGVALFWGTIVGQRAVSGMVAGFDAEIRAKNPLVADIVAFDGRRLSWPDLQKKIAEADPALLSKPAGPNGTPLREALVVSRLGQSYDFAKTQPHCLEAARLLMARGATLSPEEEANQYDVVWMAGVLRQGITLPDRSAASENPLVGWILEDTPEEQRFVIGDQVKRDPGMRDRPTRTYGTPLAAAFLLYSPRSEGARYSLLSQGARLSEAERTVPSLVRAVERMLANNPSLREKYPSPP